MWWPWTFETGKRIWQTQPQRVTEFEQLVNYSGNATAGVGGQIDTNTHPAQSFARRVWEDYLYNSISSDGEHVFVIRDLKLPEFNEIDTWAPFRGEMGRRWRRLCQSTCVPTIWRRKANWFGKSTEPRDKGELAGAYFLGAPVVVDDNLYCLAEIKSAIHLVAIDRSTGEVAWVQQLAGLQNGIELDPLRRMQAAMPSYNSGILVCPTGAGVVIGINLEKKALAWAYQYETNRNPMTHSHPREWPDAAAGLPVARRGRRSWPMVVCCSRRPSRIICTASIW